MADRSTVALGPCLNNQELSVRKILPFSFKGTKKNQVETLKLFFLTCGTQQELVHLNHSIYWKYSV